MTTVADTINPGALRSDDRRATAIVCGGGLAGISAAVRLTDAGYAVTLIETRPRLGGRATSHVDPATGEPLDNCQHVVLGCCSEMISLYDRLDVARNIEWHDTLTFRHRDGRRDRLSAGHLPAPLHLAGSFLRLSGLSLLDKTRIGRALVTAMLTPTRRRMKWADQTFADWLIARGQSLRSRRMFWDTVVISALNDVPERVSAAAALQVFLHAFCETRTGYRVGIPRVPLVRLYDAVRAILKSTGGEVRCGTAIERLHSDRSRITAIEQADGQVLSADVYVLALPPDRLAGIAARSMLPADERFGQLDRFTFSPTIGIDLRFDRPVMAEPQIALIDSPIQWLFAVETNADGQHLRAVASAADEWIALPVEEIEKRTLSLIAEFIPSAGEAQVRSIRVIKERRATFRPFPGVDRFRPNTAGAIENLFLAGDFCQTGWPATMEGAALSGRFAAEAVCKRSTSTATLISVPRRGCMPDHSLSPANQEVAPV